MAVFNPVPFIIAKSLGEHGELTEASSIFGICLLSLMILMLVGIFIYIWWENARAP